MQALGRRGWQGSNEIIITFAWMFLAFFNTIPASKGGDAMTTIVRQLAVVILILGGLASAGCAERKEYVSPYVQEETNPTYRQLYPQPFTTQPGPSATSSGDD
jgi:hypothetical protein